MKELYVMRSALMVVYWDMETMMPPKALQLRSEQLAVLELTLHKMQVDQRFAALLDEIETSAGFASLSTGHKRTVELARRDYDEASKLPDDLVTDLAKQQALTVGIWKKAKAAKDYDMFKPELAKMIQLKKRAAYILMQVKGTKTPYDALIDTFEPGMTAQRIDQVFSGMRDGLMRIMRKAETSGKKIDDSILSRKVSFAAQRRISEAAMKFIGFDTTSANAAGRLDETEHPFTTGYYDDVRITTHYYEDRFVSSLFSVLHEGGHALYDQNLPREWMYQTMGAPCSYGIHESQSRFVENMVGRSPEFLAFFMPRLRRITGRSLRGVKLRDFVAAVNAIQPSKIRVEADEVTYGLHVIIRFEMERDIFAGKLSVDDLPQAWNEKYEKYLGLEIENDSEGVMQDTHWAGGSFGYFPSYALGNIYGGMFLRKMNADMPYWKQDIRRGDFSNVKQWLVSNVHSKGNLYDPGDLVRVVTGQDLTIEPFLTYLDEKCDRLMSGRI